MTSKSRARWIGLWCGLLLAFGSATEVSAQTAGFFVEAETVSMIGEQFDVTVSVQGNELIGGFNFDLCHDETVLRKIDAVVAPAVVADAELTQVIDFVDGVPCNPVVTPTCPDDVNNVSFAVIMGIQAPPTPLAAVAPVVVATVTYELIANLPGGQSTVRICTDGGSLANALITLENGDPFPTVDGTTASATVQQGVDPCAAPTNVTCLMVPTGVQLNWMNTSTYDSITISDLDGFVATLAGTDTSYLDVTPGAGTQVYTVTGNCPTPPGGSAASDSCTVQMIELSIDNVVAGAMDTSVEVPIRLTFGAGEVFSGQFGILYDFNRLQLIEVLPGANFPTMETIIAQQAMTGAPQNLAGMTVTFIADDGVPNAGPIPPLLPPNNIILLARFDIQTPNDNTPIPLEFTSGLPQPNGFPLPVLLSLNLDPVTPMQTDGSVSFVTTEFLRGDANEDGLIGLGDVVRLLQIMFVPSAVASIPQCNDAFDVDNSETLTITDPIYLLTYLFGGGPTPQMPFPGLPSFPGCGGDTGPATAIGGGSLDCAVSPAPCN